MKLFLTLVFLGYCNCASAFLDEYDPCAVIAGLKWVSPAEARACLQTFPVNETIKANIIEVVNKTLAFHTSTNYQLSAPEPYTDQVHEDLIGDLNRLAVSRYPSEFAFHLDLYQSFRRVNDGHCVVLNFCYDSAFISYVPLPLVLLTTQDGSQNVFIAPEAYNVSKAEFGDHIDFWESSLPSTLLPGGLESLSGSKVILIDGNDPFDAVNENAHIAGGYQSFATRQNSFFSSYSRGSDWQYVMGNFAQLAHPLKDTVELTIIRQGHTTQETFTIPYSTRLGTRMTPFTNSSTYYTNNCLALPNTNGLDLYSHNTTTTTPSSSDFLNQQQQQARPESKFEQQPVLNYLESRRYYGMNVMLDSTPVSDIDLPRTHIPGATPTATGNLVHLNESYHVAQFYMLEDGETGVLALGSFSAPGYSRFATSLLAGLEKLGEMGAKKLIVDVTNNGGGYICIAHYLHRIIIGPKDTTEPQAGLDTQTRAGPLARTIVKQISQQGEDPYAFLLYNPIQWRNASHVTFPQGTDWLDPIVDKVINGRGDAFSQRLGQECQPFDFVTPDVPLFNSTNVVIMSNGRCASSCSLFSITMSKHEGVRTVVVGGKLDEPQAYCGVVGGQSTNYAVIDTEIKSTGLANHTLSPPDFISNIIQGITWRLGFGIDDPTTPEEWQDHPATHNLPLSLETVNKPEALWKEVAVWAFGGKSTESESPFQFQVQSGERMK